jgi:hypothetical protein
MLIRAFGQYWNPDSVDWGKLGAGNRGTLLGNITRKKKKYVIDFWNAKGIYVLHADFKAVYVGKTDGTKLGPRLRQHLTDRFGGRWDMFSWFATSTIAAKKGRVRDPGKRSVEPGTVVSTLEALAILVADPALNRKRESIPDALIAEQAKGTRPKTVRHYLETILERIDSR